MLVIDELIRTRRRTLSISVEDDGRLVVRAPMRLANRRILDFVKSKHAWIINRQALVQARIWRYQPKRFVVGEQFLFLGDSYPLEIKDSQSRPLVFDGSFRLARTALPRAGAAFERWYRRQALKVISERVDWYAAAHGFAHNGIHITSARKQWGSCGPQGDLRFAWRLIMAPLPILDYIVVHELVHLKHHNHSKRFWAAVKSILPDFEGRDRWLKDNGFLLNLD
ncbi:MAG TPA: SprT family zinc-dependent metalloprotease [Anaerolineales bacterium]